MALPIFISGIDFGEGPRWHDGRLWFSDFYQRTVSSVGPNGIRSVEFEIDDSPSGLGWLPDGRLLVVAMHAKKVLRREHDGSIVEHADISDLATGQCNDMVVAADGTAYVGNFGYDLTKPEMRRPAVLAKVSPDGAVSVAATDMRIPNGMVITPDGKTLIVGETSGRRLTAFSIAEDGSLYDRRLWADLGRVMADGCTLDAEGGIWVADAGGPAVIRVLEGGEITHGIEPGQPTFACTLGGDDGRTLYILCSDSGGAEDCIGKAQATIRTLRVDIPHAGRP